LQNGGYYFALSDNYDLTILEITIQMVVMDCVLNPYAKRYAFRGNLNFRYENLITSERGYPDYAKQKIYNIQWSHARVRTQIPVFRHP
jgi:hypothetical protein